MSGWVGEWECGWISHVLSQVWSVSRDGTGLQQVSFFPLDVADVILSSDGKVNFFCIILFFIFGFLSFFFFSIPI